MESKAKSKAGLLSWLMKKIKQLYPIVQVETTPTALHLWVFAPPLTKVLILGGGISPQGRVNMETFCHEMRY